MGRRIGTLTTTEGFEKFALPKKCIFVLQKAKTTFPVFSIEMFLLAQSLSP